MKEFLVPEVEVIRFAQKDVIATSVCTCVDCQVCPEGKDNCQCVDFSFANQ